MADPATNPQPPAAGGPQSHPLRKGRLSTRARILFFLTAWVIVLMPFLFWWSSWFGRQLSDSKIDEYLRDDRKPRHIQHALLQIGERMAGHDPAVTRWYPDLVRLASYPVAEVRNTDAWVMGQDPSAPQFHEALLKMLEDNSQMVRGNAALALVRFGDASGRAQIVAMLQAASITAPRGGTVVATGRVGAAIHQGGAVARLQEGTQTLDVRSPIAGRIRSLEVRSGSVVTAGARLAFVDPGMDQVWESLRALYLVGQMEDLPAVVSYQHDLPDIPERVRQQAVLTERAIRQRAKQ